MTIARQSEWSVPVMLILLSLVPAAAGTRRVMELVVGAPTTAANVRFVAAPVPVVRHVIAAIPYAILGAFQFSPALRRRRREWHRAAGRMLVVFGLVVALTGLWMAQFYAWPDGSRLGNQSRRRGVDHPKAIAAQREGACRSAVTGTTERDSTAMT